MGYHERTSWAALMSFPVGTVIYWWLVERQTAETGFWETMPTLSTIILSIVATIVFTVIAVIIATIATGAGVVEHATQVIRHRAGA